MSVNKVILIGRLTKDPETRFMTNSEAVCNFSLATSEKWKDKSGEKHEKSEYHNITAYRKLAEIIAEYVKKGSLIYIEGKLQTRKWQDKEGKDRYTTEIIADQMQMLGGKTDQQDKAEPASKREAPPKSDNFNDFDSNIPF